MSDNEFSVYQWFPDGSYERYKSFVGAEEAVSAVKFLTNNVASRMGITQRVIITDGGDCVAWEWLKDKGVVFGEDVKPDCKGLLGECKPECEWPTCETHKDAK